MGGATATERNQRTTRVRRRRVVVIAVAVLAVWLLVGAVRAPAIARDYFERAHGGGVTVLTVEVRAAIPFIPPFWGGSIAGKVTEPQLDGLAYNSAMLLLIEPFTGWIILGGSG